MQQIDRIELALIEAAKSVAERGTKEYWSDAKWTCGLMWELARLGQSYGFYVCGRKCQSYGQGEWIYDLVWLRQGNGTAVIADVPLILEMEWSTNQKNIDEDFQKLIVGRAQHRVMMFQQKDDVEPVFQRLKHQVQKFTRKQLGDRFLLLGWQYDNGTAEWKFELVVV